jgi:hypothetical protein
MSISSAAVTVTYLSHGIDGVISKFLNQKLSFLQPDTMFASDSSFHRNRTFAHTMNNILSGLLLRIVV